MSPKLIISTAPELHIWQGSNPDVFSSMYNEAFALWDSVWRSTFLHLEGSSQVYSDDFTRQDRIYSIFSGGLCVAVAGHKFFNLSQATALRDSYFKPWAPEHIHKLGKNGNKIFALNYLAVHPEYRGPLLNGLSFKDLLISLSVFSLLNSDFDAMSGVTRNNKGVNRSAYDSSGKAIAQDLNYHNVPIDLVAFYRTEIDRSHRNLSDLLVYKIWKNRNEHTTRNAINGYTYQNTKEAL